MQVKIKILITLIACFTLFTYAFSDADKKGYKTIKIANFDWSVENLNVNSFRNGDRIPEARTDEEWIKAGQEGRAAWCYYENKIENGNRYGKLYNFYAVTDIRGLAPFGWHISSDEEWRKTTDFLGGEDAAGTKMKSKSGWNQDGNGINTSGFAGLPGGCRDLNGKFSSIEDIGFWWTSTQWDTTLAWYRCMDKTPWYVYRTNYHKQNGLSVRCIKD